MTTVSRVDRPAEKTEDTPAFRARRAMFWLEDGARSVSRALDLVPRGTRTYRRLVRLHARLADAWISLVKGGE